MLGVFDLNFIEWSIWSLFALITVIAGITWFVKEKEYNIGNWYDTSEIISLIAVPRAVFWETIVLVLFLFIDFNKFHLLWIFPLVWFFITTRMAKRIAKKDNIRPVPKQNQQKIDSEPSAPPDQGPAADGG